MKLNPLSFSIATAILVAAVLTSVGFAPPPRVTPVVAAEAAPALQVPVIERAAWGATGGRGAPIAGADEVVIHHFWRPSLDQVATSEAETALLRQVERSHVNNGWEGLAYNFVIFQSGRVYEVRGWGHEGAHTKGVNTHSVGIAFAIDGDSVTPSREAWQAARDLIEDGVSAGHLPQGVDVSGHRDHAKKACPGELVYPHIHQLEPAAV